jgi:hypothetical protein
MARLIRKLVNVHTGNTALPLLQRDALIGSRTLGLFDLGSTFVYPGQASPIPAGTALKNLLRGGEDAVTAGALTYAGGGAVFTPSTSQLIYLPAAFQLPADCTRFAFAVWAKLATSGYATGGTGTFTYSLGGYRKQSAGSNQYAFALTTARPGGTLQSANFGANGTNTVSLGSAALDGAVHQVIGTSHVARVYCDGALLAEGVSTTYPGSLVQPEVTDLPAIGRIGTSYIGGPGGRIYRIWMERLDSAGEELASLVARDYAANAGRFT